MKTDGRIQLANAGARQLLGCPANVSLQQFSFERFFMVAELQKRYDSLQLEPPLSVDTPPNFECLVRCCQSARGEEFDEGREWTLKRYDGTTLRISLAIEPIFGEDDRVLGFVAIAQDVTERSHMQTELQQSRLLLAGVLDSSIDGIMGLRSIRDPDSERIVDFQWIVSNFAAQCFVSCQDTSLVGKYLRRELPEEDDINLFEEYVAVVERGGVLEREFSHNRPKPGHWVQLTAVKLGDGLTVTLRDVTKTKTIETALQQTNDELQTQIHVLDSRNRDMFKLGQLNEYLQVCGTTAEAYEAVAAHMPELFPGCSGMVYRIDDSSQMTSVASWGDRTVSAEIAPTQDCWALRRGRFHHMERGVHDLCCNHVLDRDAVAVSLCLPLSAQESSFGLLYLWADTPAALPKSKHQLANTVAEQLALSIANLRLRESLELQSTSDPLTGLFNRRYMEDTLDRLLHAAHLQKKTLGIIVIDIDRFKSFNDRYGHEVGDLVLREVAQAVSSILRRSDVACRYGGEEFVVILPEASIRVVTQRAEEIRQRIAQLELHHTGRTLDRVTASFGISSFPECGADRRTLVRVADDALYRAKNDGRNCVRIAVAIADRVKVAEPVVEQLQQSDRS